MSRQFPAPGSASSLLPRPSSAFGPAGRSGTAAAAAANIGKLQSRVTVRMVMPPSIWSARRSGTAGPGRELAHDYGCNARAPDKMRSVHIARIVGNGTADDLKTGGLGELARVRNDRASKSGPERRRNFRWPPGRFRHNWFGTRRMDREESRLPPFRGRRYIYRLVPNAGRTPV
jgi:hypothetical protein